MMLVFLVYAAMFLVMKLRWANLCVLIRETNIEF